MARYKVFNGQKPTTVVLPPVTTGTSLKTLLQLKFFNTAKINAWGISFDGSAAATPGKVELIETGAVFGTITAHAAGDFMKMDSVEDAAANVAGVTLGQTNESGYTCTSEGTITDSRLFDAQLLPPTAPYVYQFPLGQEPKCIIGNALRVRVHFGTAVNAICWVEFTI